MSRRRALKAKLSLLAIASCTALGIAGLSVAADPIRIGVIFDYTGPLAAGGSTAAGIGTEIAFEMINERGGVEGRKLEPIIADAQSKADVAISEATRLLDQEKVDFMMGFYSSGQCVPVAQKIDQQKKFMWANVCVSSAVFKDRNLKYVFRAQVHSDQSGAASCSFVAENSKKLFGMDAKDVRIAILNEDGPYGSGTAAGNEEACTKEGMKIVLKESYARTAPDLSSVVTKMRRAKPDVILHTGYNPDITLFLRQAKEQGLKWKALIGHGAGYGQIDKLRATFGSDAEYLLNVDPVAAQLLDPSKLAPGLGDITAEMVKRYKARTGVTEVPPHTSMGFNQSWILFTDVLPRAIKKYGGVSAEALRKAALDTDIPAGGTIQGYGVKFFGPGTKMAGQNERSSPVVMQYTPEGTKIVWPTVIQTASPAPLPAGNSYRR